MFTRIFGKLLDDSLPVVFSWKEAPPNHHTRSQWKRMRRKVRKKEQPIARFRWSEWTTVDVDRQGCDGAVTSCKERILVERECGLFSEEQTAPYRGTRRTWAIDIFHNYFVRFASREHFIWWVDEPLDGGGPRWLHCGGRLEEWQLKKHLKGDEKSGVRGGKLTRFGCIDLDLHEGDLATFLEQFRILLDEFHGKDGWHFQVADKDAGGVHLVQTFRRPVLLESYRDALRKRLQALDERHPELAASARAAGMKTLGELEIFPDPRKGFRLSLCAGRTMLLDRPLELVHEKRLKREVQDVIGYVSWLSRSEKRYMPAEEVFRYVKARLRKPQPKPQAGQEERQPDKPRTKRASGGAGGLGSLGKMKGRYAQVLSDFWSGRLNVADTLNTGIRLLALPLPYYLADQQEAIDLIEKYIADLADVSFSDRLSAGNTAEVSRIVANTVRQVYEGNGGQPDPEASSAKLEATVAAWRKRGFDPTDKTTWYKAVQPSNLAPEFFWPPEEVVKVSKLQRLLNVSLQVASDAVKFFLRLVKGHTGEIAVSFVKKLLERFGVRCGHNGKANKFLDLLRQWDWIRMTAREKWYAREAERKGRARTYAIGEAMAHKFERTAEAGPGRGPLVEKKKEGNLSFTSHRGLDTRATNLDFLTTRANNLLFAGVGDVERNKGSPC
jgi:hypothetical protein